MEEVIKMLARRTIEIGDLITHRFPLDSIEEAFVAAERMMGMHVAVCP
jgi:threonine dehydrogenase-like Zn-dependent dehydrogenase